MEISVHDRSYMLLVFLFYYLLTAYQTISEYRLVFFVGWAI